MEATETFQAQKKFSLDLSSVIMDSSACSI